MDTITRRFSLAYIAYIGLHASDLWTTSMGLQLGAVEVNLVYQATGSWILTTLPVLAIMAFMAGCVVYAKDLPHEAVIALWIGVIVILVEVSACVVWNDYTLARMINRGG